MQHLSTAFLIIALAIVVNDGGATAQTKNVTDQLADEAKAKSMTIITGPKYVNPPTNRIQNGNYTNNLEPRPPSKPPIDKQIKKPDWQHTKKADTPQNTKKLEMLQYYNQPRVHPYPLSPHKLHTAMNSVFRFPRVIPLPAGHRYYSNPSRSPVYAASTNQPYIVKSPKFSLPIQTVNGIRADFVRPPKASNTTTTTSAPTTTTRILRTKRIWPKRMLEKTNSTVYNLTASNTTSADTKNSTDHLESANTHIRIRFANKPNDTTTTTSRPTTRGYRRVTRVPKKKPTTQSPNFDADAPNDWVPIIPTHYPIFKYKSITVNPTKKGQTQISKRSDVVYPSPKQIFKYKSITANPTKKGQTQISKRSDVVYPSPKPPAAQRKQSLFVHSYGLLPVTEPAQSQTPIDRKKMVFFKRKRQLNPYLYSPYSSHGLQTPQQYLVADLHSDQSHYQPKFVTKIKHHHHHHHHRYTKTIEKPVKVPYKVEVPQPYPVEKKVPVPVPVEKIKIVDRPYPVTVEKKVPYPVPIKVPHPIPVKVVEKEYVPKPYPIIHHVPVVKHVEVPKPYPVEKRVPYPVQVAVPVDRPVAVPVEKRVPYPVPVRVLVPQPYPVERKVPYPVEVKVKEPVEVIKHVAVRVPYPQPYPVKVPHPVPVTVEKKVPYPVTVEKKVPVPVEVLVPQKVEVEKRVPVYIPKPYPVEKRVPYPVKVPYPIKVPVKVPVKVPIEIPVYIHHPLIYSEEKYIGNDDTARSDEVATIPPQHTVTVHGNTGFTGFQTRSDGEPTSSTATP